MKWKKKQIKLSWTHKRHTLKETCSQTWWSTIMKTFTKNNVRVVILNHGPRLFFRENFSVSRRCEFLSTPFFWKRHETYKSFWREKNFPWRSTLSSYWHLKNAILAIFSLFWKVGGNLGKGRTPGERWPKYLKWTQWCSSELTGSYISLLSRTSEFKSQ